VLVVDDHQDSRESLADLIAVFGADVRVAAGGPQALAIAQEFLPEVVFLDLGMPGMNGLQVAQALLADSRTRDVTLVAVTGFGGAEHRAMSLAAGIHLHMLKPVPLQALVEVLRMGPPRSHKARSENTVVVVDDNPAGLYATARGLSSQGFRVLTAQTGREALTLADKGTAMVLDVVLPDLDGIAVCRMLRARAATAALPILHLSAMCITHSESEEAHRAGSDAYLMGPAHSETIARMLDVLITARSPAR